MAEPKLPPLPALDPEERIVTMPERFTGAALAYTPVRESGISSAAGSPKTGSAAPARTARPPLWLFILLGIIVLGAIGGGVWWFMLRTPAAPAPVANANTNRPAVNRNANAPVIRNANQNLNANAPAATTTPATATSTPSANANVNANANVPVPPAPVGPVRVAPDADADGLTDAEETEIYQSDPGRPDTDGDGYLDGIEVLNLFSPTASARATLLSSGSVIVGTEAAAGYELLAPASWQRQVIDAQNGTVAWSAQNGEFVQLLVQENADALPLIDWYLAQAPGVTRAQITALTTKSGLAGIRSPDGFTSYVALSPTRVLIVSYSLGGRTEASYRRSYEMMVNAVKLLVPAAPAPAAATSTP